jgi:hypothetical protein
MQYLFQKEVNTENGGGLRDPLESLRLGVKRAFVVFP